MQPYRKPALSSEPPGRGPTSRHEPSLGPIAAVHRRSLRGFWWMALPIAVISQIAGSRSLIVGLVLTVVWGIRFFAFLPKEERVRQNGLEIVRWRGEPRVLRWTELSALYFDGELRGATTGTVKGLRFVANDGRQIRVTLDHEHAKLIFEGVMRAAVDPIREEALVAFQAGEELHFGPVRVSDAGVAIGELDAKWPEIDFVAFSVARLRVVTKAGVSATVPMRQIPFPTVLLAVATRASSSPVASRHRRRVRPSLMSMSGHM
jgi:hypothetical protein